MKKIEEFKIKKIYLFVYLFDLFQYFKLIIKNYNLLIYN